MFVASLLDKEPSHSLPYKSPAGGGLRWSPFTERANVLSKVTQLQGLSQDPNPGVLILTLCSPHHTWRCVHSWSLLRRPGLGERQCKSFPQNNQTLHPEQQRAAIVRDPGQKNGRGHLLHALHCIRLSLIISRDAELTTSRHTPEGPVYPEPKFPFFFNFYKSLYEPN